MDLDRVVEKLLASLPPRMRGASRVAANAPREGWFIGTASTAVKVVLASYMLAASIEPLFGIDIGVPFFDAVGSDRCNYFIVGFLTIVCGMALEPISRGFPLLSSVWILGCLFIGSSKGHFVVASILEPEPVLFVAAGLLGLGAAIELIIADMSARSKNQKESRHGG